MKSLIIGRGEIGGALYKVLSDHYKDTVYSFDIKDKESTVLEDILQSKDLLYLHICIPWSDNFIDIVNSYINNLSPTYVVVHSSVLVGTCEQLEGTVFHSPVRGKHPDISDQLKVYVKYIGYNLREHSQVNEVSEYFNRAGIPTELRLNTRTTELMKLLELSRYGVYIAFAKEQEDICKKFGVNYQQVVTSAEMTRNSGIETIGNSHLKQPILYPFDNFVGGHCTVEDMDLLLRQIETPLLKVAHDIDKNTKIWGNCNIYPTAKIGKGCSIGQFCEIGNNVKIGNNVRIGAFTFLPEGVEIEDDVFVAPRVSISNDKHPPSSKLEWGKVLIKKGAVIGMGAIILSGVTIGEKAVIGADAIVTKDVGAGEVWYGIAANHHGDRSTIYTTV